MSKPNESYEYKGYTIEIWRDQFVESPARLLDYELFLVAKHRQFYVPEPGESRVPECADDLLKKYKKTHRIFPLEAYIHGGVVLALSGEGNFPDRMWDVSQLGFVFASKKEWDTEAKARAAAEGLINTWNQYLSGDVWEYVVKGPDGFEDSCGGHYGLDYCKEEAEDLVTYRIAKGLVAKE